MTTRDRSVVVGLLIAAVLAAFWFLAVSPRRDEVSKLREQVSTARQAGDAAEARAAAGLAAKRSYTKGAAASVQLVKAVPQVDDQAALLYQLQDAAGHSRVNITAVKPADPAAPATPTPTPTPAPAAGGAQPVAAVATPVASPAVTPVAISLEFEGTYRDLQRFLARIHGFTSLSDRRITVRGRLVSVRSVELEKTEAVTDPVHATIAAEVYVAPAPAVAATPAGGATAVAGTGAAPAGSSAPPTTPAMIGAGG